MNSNQQLDIKDSTNNKDQPNETIVSNEVASVTKESFNNSQEVAVDYSTFQLNSTTTCSDIKCSGASKPDLHDYGVSGVSGEKCSAPLSSAQNGTTETILNGQPLLTQPKKATVSSTSTMKKSKSNRNAEEVALLAELKDLSSNFSDRLASVSLDTKLSNSLQLDDSPWEHDSRAITKAAMSHNTQTGAEQSMMKESLVSDTSETAQDAALLAELRAISNASLSKSRFTSRSGPDNGNTEKRNEPQFENNDTFPQTDTRPINEVLPDSFEKSENMKKEILSNSSTVTSKGNGIEATSIVSPDYSLNPSRPSNSIGHVHNINCGERSGPAEDAAFLAELGAISNSSSSRDRFRSDNNNTIDNCGTSALPIKEEEVEVVNAKVPPWKRGKSTIKTKSSNASENVAPKALEVLKSEDVLDVAANPKNRNSLSPPISRQLSLKGSQYIGERGGAAEDASLLAELRAISNSSSSRDRFQSDTDTTINKSGTNALPIKEEEKDVVNTNLPPWKRGKTSTKTKSSNASENVAPKGLEAEDVCKNKLLDVAANPKNRNSLSPPISRQLSLKGSQYMGERGGAAEDASLLAELRAISNSSSSRDRFRSDNDTTIDNSGTSALPITEEKIDVVNTNVPPWKRGKSSTKTKGSNASENAAPKALESEGVCKNKLLDVAANPKNRNSLSPPISRQLSLKGSQYIGERGGAAEDASLLAELRAISNSSSSRDRFRSDNDTTIDNSGTSALPITEEKIDVVNTNVPPWKRGKSSTKTKGSNASENAAPKALESEGVCKNKLLDVAANPKNRNSLSPPISRQLSLKGSQYIGERGGAAEDASLLAELRAISNSSSSRDRFRSDNDTTIVNSGTSALPIKEEEIDVVNTNVPPWKRGKSSTKTQGSNASENAAPKAPVIVTNEGEGEYKSKILDVAANPNDMNTMSPPISRQLTHKGSKYIGERGGAAEDASLLAELRSISNSSSSRDRFRSDNAITVDNSGTSASPRNEEVMDVMNTKIPPWKRGKSLTKNKCSIASESVAPKSPVIVTSEGEDEYNRKILDVSANPNDRNSLSPPISRQLSLTGSQFKGERGGAAEDASLLAELRAISNSSSSRDRFQSDTDTTINKSGTNALPIKEEEKDVVNTNVPPWKRGKSLTKNKSSIASEKVAPKAPVIVTSEGEDEFKSKILDVAATAKDRNSLSPPISKQSAYKRSQYIGEKEGAAEDASLLVELRSISNSSSSTDRFRSDNDITVDNSGTSASPRNEEEMDVVNTKIPPWKRGKSLTKNKSPIASENVAPKALEKLAFEGEGVCKSKLLDGAADANERKSLSPSISRQLSLKGSQYKGERGGAAEDASLLAELRAISNSSSSRDRFQSDYDTTIDNSGSSALPIKEEKIDVVNTNVPPWKRGKFSTNTKSFNASENVAPKAPETVTSECETLCKSKILDVAANPNNRNSLSPPISRQLSLKGSQYKGERGGAAEDASLLAELRAISNSSLSRDRFRSDNVITIDNSVTSALPIKEEEMDVGNAKLPAWKRGKSSTKTRSSTASENGAPTALEGLTSEGKGKFYGEIFDMATDAKDRNSLSPPISKQLSLNGSHHIGERGGAAEDASLLAELKSISDRSLSGSRFRSDNDIAIDSSASSALPMKEEQIYLASFESITPEAPDVITRADKALPPPFSKELPLSQSQYIGQQGVTTKDSLSALIAESSEGRFLSDNDITINDTCSNVQPIREEGSEEVSFTGHKSVNLLTSSQGSSDETIEEGISSGKSFSNGCRTAVQSSEINYSPVDALMDDICVSISDLPVSLSSKDWKIRKACYSLLASRINEICQETHAKASQNAIQSNSVMENLDDFVSSILIDGNAGALDSGLEFAYIYADQCSGAISSRQASSIVTALVNGPAFSTSRPSTIKHTNSLVIKLMEVGECGPSSIHSIVPILIEGCLHSRKPKVVSTCAFLLIETARSFGVPMLPLPIVVSGLSKMVLSTNVALRESALQLIAEICRSVGSKDPLKHVLSSLKNSQLLQVDKYLESQSFSLVPPLSLRYMNSSLVPGGSALEVLEACSQEEEKKRFDARPSVNLFRELSKTDYSSRIKLEKWSEKVGALDTILTCGGEKPYKLEKPSSSVSYAELISDLKKLLAHTHYLVSSKAMAVLSMLAEGVGDKIFPNLRLTLTVLLDLSKDKKLTSAAGKCLDSLFGNVFSFDHLMEKDDAIPSAVSELKQKNALSRTAALEYLKRCVERREKAGPRGSLSTSNAVQIALLAASKLKDSDPATRKVATEILRLLLNCDAIADKSKIQHVLEELKTSDSRVYKSLIAEGDAPRSKRIVLSQMSPDSPSKSLKKLPTVLSAKVAASPSQKALSDKHRAVQNVPSRPIDDVDHTKAKLESSLAVLSQLSLPKWDDDEESGGILAGLKSLNWKFRKHALQFLTSFLEEHAASKENQHFPSDVIFAVFFVSKEHTKLFKDSNMNIIKAIFDLFTVVLSIHVSWKRQPDKSFCSDSISLAIDKVGDKKFYENSCTLLYSLCEVCPPETILTDLIAAIDGIKAPLPRELLLQWCTGFFQSFGVKAAGNCIPIVARWIIKEIEGSNQKIRKAALDLASELHTQLGPAFKGIVFHSREGPISPSVKNLLDGCFSKSLFNPAASSIVRSRICLTIDIKEEQDNDGGGSAGLAYPTVDLMSTVPGDILTRMGSKEGKNAWKIRKDAMEIVLASLESCGGIISCAPTCIPGLVELVKVIAERLGDSQSNLKPLAATLIRSIFASVTSELKVKLGRIVFPYLVNAALTDSKQTMRDAAMTALVAGTTKKESEGGGPNSASLETFLAVFVSSIKEADFKSIGLPELLRFTYENVQFLPKISPTTSSARVLGLELHFAHQLVACLASSRAEVRHSAETLMKSCAHLGVLSSASVLNGLDKLLPAQQRGVRSIVLEAFKQESSAISDKEDLYEGKQAVGSLRASKSDYDDNTFQSPAKEVISHHPRLQFAETNANEKPSQSSMQVMELPVHPLVQTSVQNQRQMDKVERVSAKKKDNWPEFPEVPSGKDYFMLRKIWVCYLPPDTISILLPQAGFTKQDDAIPGIDILSDAVKADKRNSNKVILIDHLDFIFKWITFVLNCRESTTGMQAILSFIIVLFQFLVTREYNLTDCEAIILLPHLLEKGGASKGRFREVYKDILGLCMKIYHPQKFGTFICVPVMERSSNAKARCFAMNECKFSVKLAGPSAISKRGLQHICKTIAEECLLENRLAALELAEEIIKKLNGDTNRFYNACGNVLSIKSKSMIEERWLKHNSLSVESNADAPKVQLRQENLRQVAPTASKALASTSIENSQQTTETLTLSLSQKALNPESLQASKVSVSYKTEEGPFTFKYTSSCSQDYNSVDACVISCNESMKDRVDKNSAVLLPLKRILPESESLAEKGESDASAKISASAASLRARLKKIRDRSSMDPNQPPVALENPQKTAVEKHLSPIFTVKSNIQESLSYINLCDKIDSVLQVSLPISSTCSEVIILTDMMEKSLLLIESHSDSLINDVKSDVSGFVSRITSLIDFSFHCGTPSEYSGILFPLVLATISALTALFRNIALVQNITSTALQFLIKHVSVALLDSRLTAGALDARGALDVESSSLLVKALNRLAIQSAIGSPRHTSLQALMMLQIDYASNNNNMNPDKNSRLARISTKLFTRVIKSEEASTSAFSRNFDLGALLCTVENFLMLSSNIEKHSNLGSSLNELATTLLTAIIHAQGVSSEHELMTHMKGSGIDLNNSRLGKLIKTCIPEAPRPQPVILDNSAVHDFKTESSSLQCDENCSGTRPLLTTERIQALRSKIHSTDKAMQEVPDVGLNSYLAPSNNNEVLRDATGSRAALLAIRERLAAAQESRLPRAASNGSFLPSDVTGSVTASHSTALRSRLEAMKKRHLH